MHPATPVLNPWSSFFVMTGSSAAALTGLMFIVITLVSGTERVRRSGDGLSAFSTPTVVHFGAALLVSAILSAPWRLLLHPAVLLGVAGLCGIIYVGRVVGRMKKLREYGADVEDWIWYSVLPFVAYAAMLCAAILLLSHPVTALFLVGGSVVLLIFIGIRNSWDVVTFLTLNRDDEPPASH